MCIFAYDVFQKHFGPYVLKVSFYFVVFELFRFDPFVNLLLMSLEFKF